MKNKPGRIELSLLMPCLNEEETLGKCIDEVRPWLEEACGKAGYEILVADNGSVDRSVKIAEEHGARVVHVGERGYGKALLGGIEGSRGRFIIMADSDLSYNPDCIPRMLDCLRGGSDVVMGNRFQGGIDKGAMPLLHRYLGNPVLSFIGRLFFGLKVGDFHCGIRGFDRDAIVALGLQSGGMEFASEMIVRSGLAGKKITEVPAKLRKDGRNRKPHLRTWSDGWRHLRFLLLYCPTWLFTIPGLVLLLGGVFLGLVVLPGPARFSSGWGGFTLDLNSLVYAAVFVIGGFQLLATGSFAKVFAKSHGLLPPGRKSAFESFTLEWGVLAGATLFLAGCVGTIVAWVFWAEGDYSSLNPNQTLRIVIPSATALTLGIQLSITSFLVGVVELTKTR